MSRRKRTVTVAAAGLLAAALAFSPASATPRQEPDDRDSMREDLQETIEIYMIARMSRVLELTDDQQRTVIPLVEELNAARRGFNRERRLALTRLRPMVEERPGDEKAVEKILEDLDAMERDLRDRESKARERIRASLTPVQQGRFLLFQDRFRNEMQERIRRMDQRGPDGPPGARPRPGGERPPRRPRP